MLNQYIEKCEQLVVWLEELKYLRRENEWLKLKLLRGKTNNIEERYNAFMQYKANKTKVRNKNDQKTV